MFKFFKKDKTADEIEQVEESVDAVTEEVVEDVVSESVDVEQSFSDTFAESEESEEVAETTEEVAPETENKGFFKRLVAGLSKTRNSIVNSIDSVFSAFSSIDEDLYEELEEILITSDIGVKTTMEILDNLRDEVKEKHIKEPGELRE